MTAVKAIIAAALITGAIFLIIFWIVPVITFLVIALVAYAIFYEQDSRKGPPF